MFLSLPQDFEVFDPSTGADLGSIDTTDTVTNLLGLTNTAFTVEVSPLPTVEAWGPADGGIGV